MKKIFTLGLLSVFAALSYAQQLTNANFESWTDSIPDSWSTTRSLVPSVYIEVQDTSAPYLPGTSAVQITTTHVGSPIDTFSGFLHYGTVEYSGGNVVMNHASFPCLPDSIQFAYKYTQAPTDPQQAGFAVYFSIGGVDVDFIDGEFLTPTSTYQVITNSFYLGAGTQIPDSINLTFYSDYSFTANYPAVSGSTLWVDDVHFIYNHGPNCKNANGVQQIGADQSIKLFPNPANQQITLTSNATNVGSQIRMYDRIGREVYSGMINGAANVIRTDALESGYYLVRVEDTDGSTIYSSGIAVIH